MVAVTTLPPKSAIASSGPATSMSRGERPGTGNTCFEAGSPGGTSTRLSTVATQRLPSGPRTTEWKVAISAIATGLALPTGSSGRKAVRPPLRVIHSRPPAAAIPEAFSAPRSYSVTAPPGVTLATSSAPPLSVTQTLPSGPSTSSLLAPIPATSNSPSKWGAPAAPAAQARAVSIERRNERIPTRTSTGVSVGG